MPRRVWAALLLAPLGLLALATQVAMVLGLCGIGSLAWGGAGRDSAWLDRGVDLLETATQVLDRAWASPIGWALGTNPVTLGAADDVRAGTAALHEAIAVLRPATALGSAAIGVDGAPGIVTRTGIDVARLPELAPDLEVAAASLATAHAAAEKVPATGLLGQPVGAVADAASGLLGDLSAVAHAGLIAWPDLPEALGASEPRRYLVCALNDAESFASGGAPLSAMLVEVVRGSVSIPISGQMESKLSPNNPPINWEHAGGPPWYRPGKQYPFVNSNFHPDFRTAGVDIRRAWAALGYPEVQGVVTSDVSSLATLLAWTGPVESEGYGRVTSSSLIPTVLVDAYREFDSTEGVAQRHARNDALIDALGEHLTRPWNVLPALRGAVDSLPSRHIQGSFELPGLQRALEDLGAEGALSSVSGDVIGVFSQSGPNKLTVFQERAIRQHVQLTADGGAVVQRTVRFANAVPSGLEGDPTSYAGYTALRARMRVAYRIPAAAVDHQISTGDSTPLVPADRTGPFDDGRGAAVLWQGQETAPGEASEVQVSYRLPAGTFPPGTYQVTADPQALPLPADLEITVAPPPGGTLDAPTGWRQVGAGLRWAGVLDRPLALAVP